ncbi:MAG: hypothetical protein H0X33_14495 [Taibaiella sp.]|nr:hypothetical protein [Taibaiella sp.]
MAEEKSGGTRVLERVGVWLTIVVGFIAVLSKISDVSSKFTHHFDVIETHNEISDTIRNMRWNRQLEVNATVSGKIADHDSQLKVINEQLRNCARK